MGVAGAHQRHCLGGNNVFGVNGHACLRVPKLDAFASAGTQVSITVST